MLIDGHVLCCVDEVEKVIGLLLRETGDRLNEEVRNQLLGHVGQSLFVKVWHLSVEKMQIVFLSPPDKHRKRSQRALFELQFL